MNILRSIVMAFQMFSRISMPQIKWQKENMHYVFAAFPFLGLVLGGLLWLWSLLAEYLAFGNVLFAVGLTLIPVLYTGAIHLDGFCDTVDALASHAEAEKKRAILKDPHAGAFAVIGVCVYLLAYFGLSTEMPRSGTYFYLLILVPALSRSVAGIASITFPLSSGTGLQSTFQHAAKKKIVILVLLLWVLGLGFAMLYLKLWLGLALLLVAALTAVYVYFMSRKQFGGMSGDITGYLLQVSELLLLATLVFLQRWIVI